MGSICMGDWFCEMQNEPGLLAFIAIVIIWLVWRLISLIFD
jgi:hypothetical protein